jgi:hypothetical protein
MILEGKFIWVNSSYFAPTAHRLHIQSLGCNEKESLGLPIVPSALSGMVFCLEFSPFFFLLLFPWQVFFLYLFICLFKPWMQWKIKLQF